MNTKDPPLENLKLIINLLNQKNFNQSLALSTELRNRDAMAVTHPSFTTLIR